MVLFCNPAEVAEELMKSEDVGAALERLIKLLETKTIQFLGGGDVLNQHAKGEVKLVKEENPIIYQRIVSLKIS